MNRKSIYLYITFTVIKLTREFLSKFDIKIITSVSDCINNSRGNIYRLF